MEAQPAKPKSALKLVLIILGVLFVLGGTAVAVLVGVVANAASGKLDEAKVSVTRNTQRAVAAGLRLYYAKHGKYPDDRQGLQVLVQEKILDRLPKDAWERAIDYRTDGQGYVLTSFGADGARGGEGMHADIEHRAAP